MGTSDVTTGVDATQRRDRAGARRSPTAQTSTWPLASPTSPAYADASLKPLSWVTLRGGLRADFYHYLVTNRCALTTQNSFGGDPLDTECFSSDRVGYRNPEQTASSSASIFEPRLSLLIGTFRGFTFSVSYGRGSRSIDPQYINQDLKSPFAKVDAAEFGVAYSREVGRVELSARSVFFQTHVDKDLFFNETEGRNTLANGTTRTGWAGNARATGSFFDIAGEPHAHERQVRRHAPRDPVRAGVRGARGRRVVRALPLNLSGSVGAGVSGIGKRPLPYGEFSESTFLVDVGASVRYHAVSIGLISTNLFDRRYRLGEYNYVSDFRSQDYPTLVAARPLCRWRTARCVRHAHDQPQRERRPRDDRAKGWRSRLALLGLGGFATAVGLPRGGTGNQRFSFEARIAGTGPATNGRPHLHERERMGRLAESGETSRWDRCT